MYECIGEQGPGFVKEAIEFGRYSKPIDNKIIEKCGKQK